MRTSARNVKQLQRGYVLLLVLIAVIISSVALTRLAGITSQLGTDAVAGERALQQRWAMKTCDAVVLPRIGQVLTARDSLIGRFSTERRPPIIIDQIRLAGTNVRVTVADENSKLNLNSLYHATDKRIVQQELTRALSPGIARTLSLRPVIESAAAAEKRSVDSTEEIQSDADDLDEAYAPAFRSWGEVFDFPMLRRNLGSDRVFPSITGKVTLWGDGSLNVVRASDASFLSTCRPIVQDGLAKRIVERYRESPETGIKLIVGKEVRNPQDKQRLLDLLGEESRCFSVWVESESRNQRQRTFSVIQPDREGVFRTIAFRM